MRARILVALVLPGIAAGFAGCGTLGKHYDDSLAEESAPAAPTYTMTARISIESKPPGAMITLNGSQVGTGPVSVVIEIDATGKFADATEMAADFSVSAPVRGVSSLVTVRYRRGETAPRLIILGRPADGGIQSLGNVLIRR